MIRWMLVIAAVVLLLPTDAQQQAQVYQRVSAGAAWAVTFCDRNAETCNAAGEVWSAAKVKAAFAARMAADIVQERMLGTGTAAERAGVGAKPQHPKASPASGTLMPEDLRPGWRAAGQRSGA